jgi:menaquinone-9 beta-reductase
VADTHNNIGEITNPPWPVIIIGAGPAGSVCALSLARAGYKVLLLDKYDFPRDKTCGDQLIPDSLRVLEQLNLLDRVRPLALANDRIRVFSPGRIDFIVRCDYLAIKRRDFDHVMLQAAIEAGVAFMKAKVVDIKPSASDPTEVYIDGSAEPLRAQVVVIATGASVHLADKLGLIDRRTPSAVAMRTYFESDYRLEENVLSYDRSLTPGYGWIFQVSPNLFNIGCGHLVGPDNRGDNLRTTVESFLADFPIARDLVARGRRVSDFHGAPIRCGLDGCRALVKDNVVCIGEVIGATFPFTGEGIGKAMQSAMIAGEVIDHALRVADSTVLNDYTARIDTELRPRYHGYTVAEKWFSRPWICDLIARRIRHSGHLQDQLAHLAADTGDPRGLFSISSLVQSFWK